MINSRLLGPACLFAGLLAAACSNEPPTAPANEPGSIEALAANRVSFCHRTGLAWSPLDVSPADLSSHRSHGDYQTLYVVTHRTDLPDNGIFFPSITSALAAARGGRLARGETIAAACRITILVAPGVFHGTTSATDDPALEHFPLVVDVPDITLRGALQMRVDGRGRATGTGFGNAETTLAPAEPLGDDPITGASTPVIVVNGHPDGSSAGNGLVVEGFVFQSGHVGVDEDGNGQAVFALRVKGLVIRGNRIEAEFSEGMDLRATSAIVQRNHIAGTTNTCDICLAGPGRFEVSDNRVLGGTGIDGILATPVLGLPEPADAEEYEIPATADIAGLFRNNEVRDHLAQPVGVGIRVGAIGLFAPDVRSSSHYTLEDNSLINGAFGVIIDGGFPEPDALLKGDMQVETRGNVIRQSCQANLLVSLARHTTGLGIKEGPYLLNSTYQLRLGGDVRWADAWYSNPDGFGNRLIVDGHPIPNGQRAFYDPDTCPGLAAGH
ncbi:MAG: hypothetical protein ABJC74_11805 [Gemmatimonadota bacterium]